MRDIGTRSHGTQTSGMTLTEQRMNHEPEPSLVKRIALLRAWNWKTPNPVATDAFERCSGFGVRRK